MKKLIQLVSTMALAITAIAAFAGPASASIGGPFSPGADHVVFVQNNSTTGNQVFAYDRAPNGTLSPAGAYATGGVGGVLAGSVVDHLASQGSLTYDRRHGLLYAVNAGSNSVSVFAVIHDRLYLRQILPSGGSFPVSVAVHNDLVYVLNARNGGSVQGYRVFFNVLIPIDRSNRPLGLDPTATPEFTNTPGQVAFSPNGAQLIVTTKANGNDIDVFAVRFDGRLSAPVVNPEPGDGSVRHQLRPGRPPGDRRGGSERARDLHVERRRHDHPDRSDRDGTGGDLLGRAGGRALLRLERGKRHAERLPVEPRRWTDAARHDPDRRRHR